MNILITAKEPQSVTVDISAIKGFIKPIAGALDKRFGASVQVGDVPDSLVLIQKGEIPSIYGWAVVLLWVGPILGLIGIAILAGLIWRAASEDRPAVLRVAGSVLAIGSVVFVVLVRGMKAPILASVTSGNGKIIVGDIFDAFSAGLTAQTWLLAIIGLILIGAGYVLPRAWWKQPTPEKLREAA